MSRIRAMPVFRFYEELALNTLYLRRVAFMSLVNFLSEDVCILSASTSHSLPCSTDMVISFLLRIFFPGCFVLHRHKSMFRISMAGSSV